MRINNLLDPEPLPLDTPYGLIVRAEHPVVAQMVRTGTRRGNLTVTVLPGHPAD